MDALENSIQRGSSGRQETRTRQARGGSRGAGGAAACVNAVCVDAASQSLPPLVTRLAAGGEGLNVVTNSSSDSGECAARANSDASPPAAAAR